MLNDQVVRILGLVLNFFLLGLGTLGVNYMNDINSNLKELNKTMIEVVTKQVHDKQQIERNRIDIEKLKAFIR